MPLPGMSIISRHNTGILLPLVCPNGSPKRDIKNIMMQGRHKCTGLLLPKKVVNFFLTSSWLKKYLKLFVDSWREAEVIEDDVERNGSTIVA